jgi:hypothetical protein
LKTVGRVRSKRPADRRSVIFNGTLFEQKSPPPEVGAGRKKSTRAH